MEKSNLDENINENIQDEILENERDNVESTDNTEKLSNEEVEELNGDIQIDKESSLEGIVEELKSSNKNLINEKNKLENELDAIKDRLLRLNSEYDNFRKRTVKEKEGIYNDACEDVLKNMLSVMDNLERAVSVEGSVDDVKKGIEMTMKQFSDSLEKLQVEEISTEGEFDPNLHNAVMHVEDDKYDDNQIVEVLQKGYKRENKVLRYSMVKVAN